MNRRNLLKGLLGVVVAPVVAKALPNPEVSLSGSAIALLHANNTNADQLKFWDAHAAHVREHMRLGGWAAPAPDDLTAHLAAHRKLWGGA